MAAYCSGRDTFVSALAAWLPDGPDAPDTPDGPDGPDGPDLFGMKFGYDNVQVYAVHVNVVRSGGSIVLPLHFRERYM